MEANEILAEMLTDLTSVYSGNEFRIPVLLNTMGNNSIAKNGESIQIDPTTPTRIDSSLTGGQELAILANLVSHEVEHAVQSNLGSKHDFVMNNVMYAEVAGAVINILEDAYIDYTRTQRFPGLKRTEAFSTAVIMSNDKMRPPVNTIPPLDAMVEGMAQIAACGTAKGIEDADEAVQQFLGWVTDEIDMIRRTDSPDDRYAAADFVLKTMLEWAGKPPSTLTKNELIKMRSSRTFRDHAPLDEEMPSPVTIETERRTVLAMMTDDDDDDAEDDDDDEEPSATFKVDLDNPIQVTMAARKREYSPDDPTITSPEKSMIEWLEIDAGNDLTDTSTYDKKYERLQERIASVDEYVKTLKRTRDLRLEDGGGCDPDDDWGHKTILDEYADSGLGDAITAAFEELKSADAEFPARVGQRPHLHNIVRRVSGDTSTVEMAFRREIAEVGDRAIGVVCDMSGSMSDKQNMVKMAILALADACEIVEDEFAALAFNRDTDITLINAFDEAFDPAKLDAVYARSNDPMYRGMDTMATMMEGVSAREKLIIVISDGDPTVNSKGGSSGVFREIQDFTTELRSDHKIGVVGLGVGGGIDIKRLNNLFGEGNNVHARDPEQVTAALIDVYTRQMDGV